MRIPQPAGRRGSLKWMQEIVETRPELLNTEVRTALGLDPNVGIDWRSPRGDDERAEYRDRGFLERVGLGDLAGALSEFWPRLGPQWDGLARTTDGKVILVEAKAHASELGSTCAASPASRARIERALEEARAFYGARADADWLTGYYQYANRLAHLYFLRERCGVDAHLVFLYFAGDPEMKGPASREEWEQVLETAHRQLGLPETAPPEGVHNVFIDVAQLTSQPSTG